MARIRDVLTTRGRAFVASGVTLLLGGLVLGFTDVTRPGVLLVALPLLAALMTGRRGDDILVTRTVNPTRLVVDQPAHVHLVLKNSTPRRTRLQVAEERVHHLLGDRPRFVLAPMEPGDVRAVDYQISSQVRGRYRLGPLHLRTRDPYGLTTVSTSVPGCTDVLVLPRVEVLGGTSPRGEAIGTEGAIPHLVAQHGEDDVTVRGYRDGDDLRRIHWPATAHRSQLMVRQEDHPARRRAVIVLDSRSAGHRGSDTHGSFEWAVTAASSLAAHLSARRYALHLLSDETVAQGTARQVTDITNALDSLAMARLGAGQQFDEVVGSAQSVTVAGGLVIAIVTDHDDSVLRRIAALREPGGTAMMFLLDSASFARQRPTEGTDRTMALAAMVAATGWSTCVVHADMTVAQAWDVVSAGTGAVVGTRW